MSEVIEMEVAVHKAKISLKSGESISDYTAKLRNEGREHVMKKLSIGDSEGSAWMAEAFSTKAVFSVYKYDSGEGDAYFSTTYKRKEDSSFEFGDVTEVERVTTFEPKSGTGVQDVSKNLDGWVKVKKSFWGGLI